MTTKPALRVRWNRSNDEGWGHWGGVAVSKRKKKKRILCIEQGSQTALEAQLEPTKKKPLAARNKG
jgi:hypothetical protein